MSYQGPALDVPRFFTDLAPAANAAAFAIENSVKPPGWPLLALKRSSVKPDAPAIYLSAGIHGDEPAGPLALLRLLQNKYFADDHHWLICPVLNPGGLLAKTRHNPGDVDLNREYRNPQASETRQHLAFLQRECAGRHFALSILLHEDWETKGYYMYELTRTGQKLIGPAILAAVDPICGIDRSPIIEGREAQDGLITHPLAGIAERPLWPEALWLALNHTDRNVTLEAPSAQDLERRVAAHCAAVPAAIMAAGF